MSSRLHPREVAAIAADSGARVLVADADWLAAAGWTEPPDPVRAVVVVGGAGCGVGGADESGGAGGAVSGAIAYEELLAGTGEPPLYEPKPDDPAWFLCTSGTTGRPKGVVHTQASLAAMADNVAAVLPHPRDLLDRNGLCRELPERPVEVPIGDDDVAPVGGLARVVTQGVRNGRCPPSGREPVAARTNAGR